MLRMAMQNNFTIDDIKKIRELTGVGLTDAKKALEESGSFEAALKAMRAKGLSKAAGREEKITQAGVIRSYVHDGRIGVLVEVSCETDFAAKNENFLNFVKDLCLQVAACKPTYLRLEDMNNDRHSEMNNHAESDLDAKELAEQHCLLSQNFIKDPKLTIQDLLQTQIAKLGENIIIVRFVRFELGYPKAELVIDKGRK